MLCFPSRRQHMTWGWLEEMKWCFWLFVEKVWEPGYEYQMQAITRSPTWRRISNVTLYCQQHCNFQGADWNALRPSLLPWWWVAHISNSLCEFFKFHRTVRKSPWQSMKGGFLFIHLFSTRMGGCLSMWRWRCWPFQRATQCIIMLSAIKNPFIWCMWIFEKSENSL